MLLRVLVIDVKKSYEKDRLVICTASKYHVYAKFRGGDNMNKKWLKAIEELSQKGIVFVRSSRVPQGIVFNDCVFDPHDLCISANTLSGQKARVLLMLALTKTNDIKEIRRIFELY